MDLKTQVVGLNEFLSLVYDGPIRLSTVLGGLAFSQQQIEVLRIEHAQRVVTSAVTATEEYLATRADGDRLYHILRRRFGLDGNSADTLKAVGLRLNISRERVRQLQKKAVRRCKTKRSRDFLEGSLGQVASALVGEPQERLKSSSQTPGLDSSDESMPQSREAENSEELESTAEMMAAMLKMVPIGMRLSMLAHVLFGSSGTVVNRLMAEHEFPHYGALKALRYQEVRRKVALVTEADRRFEVLQGKVSLRQFCR